VNGGYFTCWYAHQVLTNQQVTGWPVTITKKYRR